MAISNRSFLRARRPARISLAAGLAGLASLAAMGGCHGHYSAHHGGRHGHAHYHGSGYTGDVDPLTGVVLLLLFFWAAFDC